MLPRKSKLRVLSPGPPRTLLRLPVWEEKFLICNLMERTLLNSRQVVAVKSRPVRVNGLSKERPGLSSSLQPGSSFLSTGPGPKKIRLFLPGTFVATPPSSSSTLLLAQSARGEEQQRTTSSASLPLLTTTTTSAIPQFKPAEPGPRPTKPRSTPKSIRSTVISTATSISSPVIYTAVSASSSSTVIYTAARSSASSTVIYTAAKSDISSAVIYTTASSSISSTLIYTAARSSISSSVIYTAASFSSIKTEAGSNTSSNDVIFLRPSTVVRRGGRGAVSQVPVSLVLKQQQLAKEEVWQKCSWPGGCPQFHARTRCAAAPIRWAWFCGEHRGAGLSMLDKHGEKLKPVVLALGDLVRGEYRGCLTWPAIINPCPRTTSWFQGKGAGDATVLLHVTFLSESWSRAWISPSALSPWRAADAPPATSSPPDGEDSCLATAEMLAAKMANDTVAERVKAILAAAKLPDSVV